MSRVLVTGAAGFIGSHVAEHCVRLGHDVVGVDDLSGGFEENLPADIDFRQGSITDADFVAGLWGGASRFDYVYHLAAYAAEGLSHFIRTYNYTNNLIGTMLLLNQSVLHDVSCFVFTSSIAVYGANQAPMSESMVPQPEDPYGIAKYAVELDLRAAHSMFGLNYVVFRPHNVYGERQNLADRYRNVVGIFMNQVMRDEPLTVFGDGTQTRAFSHVDDVAPVIARAPDVPGAYGNVFNIGADRPYSVSQLAVQIGAAFGVDPRIQYLPARNEVVHAFATHERVREVFDPPPPVELADGIQRMADWALRRGPTPPVRFEQIEVERNLPPSWSSVVES